VNGHRQPVAGKARGRLALATVATLLVTGSLMLALATRPRPPAGATAPRTVRAVNVAALTASVRERIARQAQANSARVWMEAHHEPTGPAAGSPGPAAGREQVQATVRRWLGGYLPYEIDRLDSSERRELVSTSTPALVGELLADPPLIPPTTRQAPAAGRALEVLVNVAKSDRSASTYVEVAYGLERIGLQLTLNREAVGWRVAALHG